MDIVARFLQRWGGIALGRSLVVMNGIVFAAAAYLFSLDKLLYALIAAFIAGRMVDLVLEGASYVRQAIIISARPEQIQSSILHSLGRGVTILEGKGGFTTDQRTVLLSVVAQSEVSLLKAIVRECDPQAFVVFSNVNEVLGEGFKPAFE